TFSLTLFSLSTIHTFSHTSVRHQTIKTVCPIPFRTHRSNNTVLQFPQTPSTWSRD
ncbi:hypothetical protein CP061683_2658, partial [Chlamydia psittaci 06-1683]